MTNPTPDSPTLVGWVSLDDLLDDEAAETAWAVEADASGDLEDALLAAYGQCLRYLGPRRTVPRSDEEAARWRLAQTMQARALIRSQTTGASDSQGQDGMSVTVFPMDWTITNLLLPKTRRRRGPR